MSGNVVNDFLKTFGRTPDELFEGEKERIEDLHGDYNIDRLELPRFSGQFYGCHLQP